MTEPIFRLRNVVKGYEGHEVLNVASLDILTGEIFAVVGPSGAGKSTLLRLLNFLELPSAGAIEFGRYITNGHGGAPLDLRRRVTTVFQRPVLLNRSVYDNLAYGLWVRGQARDKQKIEMALSRVGLDKVSGQRARTLSGGEAQRVALARAIVIEPDVLLLDEPTANLDPYNVGLIEGITRELNRRQGTTVVLVTHNVFQAKRLAHRIGLFLDGQVIEVADTEQFFARPSDPRAVAFVRGDLVY
jgi:tungstate transport system ATP-binding protein